MTGFGAWVRYGDPITPSQIDFAVDHYRVAILQPWETEAAAALKDRRPDMTVLCYKCLSSTRSYEPGPVYSSGVSFEEAEQADTGEWFAKRLNGERIEWERYHGHWQMAVWNARYRDRWVENVTAEMSDSPFDGVMADNDVFDDYYGLNLPLRDVTSMSEIRAGLDELVHRAGSALNARGKILVPNIAESRRQPGRWRSHAAYGGGFEEVWLGFSPTDLFDPATTEAQLSQAAGPGISIMRVPTDGNDEHPNFRYGLAAFWIFGDGNGAFSATAHDDYSRTPHIPELDVDLGRPLDGPDNRGNTWWREFENGWAAVNFNQDGRRRRRVKIPDGMVDVSGRPAGRAVVLPPRHGVLYLRE